MIIGGSACTDNDTGDMKESKELSLQILPTVSNLVVKNRGPVGEKTLKEGTIGLSIFSKDGYSTTNGIEGSSLYEPVPEYKSKLKKRTNIPIPQKVSQKLYRQFT